ncbi:winged helix-turn-helix transcriptional regulator [Cellulomonas sp. H30R-01]|uniref:MarR family winged helix-turn-helix transcriptional regulator n=1 Tax=Cellulomonas sp. H30R-01 TaxID=2704467 RepID=UPI00138B2863|nr:MarR family winged helix-turn-helix transcriptional regulator [Cellulomonas sp. H30R-01]QHT56515.1 winged helix-turn-helix transcriptional regulator [Cellulomonas sp. H30R-01]
MATRPSDPTPPVRAPDEVVGYLLKHAHLVLEERTNAALASEGITTRDLGVMRVIAAGAARSQQEIAAVLGVDRSSMVALLDALEADGVVARRPSDRDRRRNVVELTDAGRETFLRAERASIEVETRLTEPLGADGVQRLRAALRALLAAAGH